MIRELTQSAQRTWLAAAVMIAGVLLAGQAQAQTTPQALLVTRIYNITSSWSAAECGSNGIDNRSTATRRNNYHGVNATGSGSWTATLKYSDTSCSGPWTSFGSTAAITEASNPPIAFGNGYHPYIQVAVTGAATVSYSATKDFWLSTSVGSLSFPITVPQGGTGATTYPLAGLTGQELQNFRRKPNAGATPLYEFYSPTQAIASDYDFPAQTPGGSLIAGGIGQAVTLSPCPLGIVTTGASATALYLSNGTGTAEWLRPSGGTCTSGATTGTVLLTPANNHSGAWTIRSATAGIDLACASSPLGAYVVIPPGSYDIFGTIIPSNGCTIDGLGSPSANGPSGAVFLHMRTNGIPLFDIVNLATTIKNVQLAFGAYPAYTVGGVPATAGSICIHIEPGEATGSSPYVNNVVCNNFWNNLTANNGTLRVQNFSSLQAVQDGVVIGGAPGVNAGYMEAVISQRSGGNGYTLNSQAAIQWHDVNCFDNQGWGIQINSLAAYHMDNIDCESDKLGEIHITSATNSVGILQNVVLQSAGTTYSWGTNNTSPGLKIDGVVTLGMLISNIQISNAQGNGMELGGIFTQVNNASIYGNGMGAQSGHISCFTAPGSDMILSGIYCYQGPAVISGSGNIIIGSQFLGPIVSTPSIQFTSASVANNFCNNTISNSGNTAIQYDAGTTGMACINSVIGTVTGRLGYDAETIRTIPIEPIPSATALSITSNTIAPTLPLHTVGAGLIKTITAPNIAISVCIDLIATAAFTTDTSVNIVTPAITGVVGKLYRTCYNAATALWSMTN